MFLLKSNRKSYAINRIAMFPMTLSSLIGAWMLSDICCIVAVNKYGRCKCKYILIHNIEQIQQIAK